MKRLAVLLHGLTAYAVSLATIVYGVGFLIDGLVPKGIDDGPIHSLPHAIAADLALIALFGVQHSVMARQKWKRWYARWLPEATNRSTFVLAASLVLIFGFWRWHPMPEVIWNTSGALRVALLVAYGVAWALVIGSTFLVNHFDLLGVRQVVAYARGTEYAPEPLKDSAAYRLVRHPLMASFLLTFWIAPRMTWGHALFAAGMSAYILIGIAFEERDLVRVFGTTYESYRARVPMLIPRLTNPRHPADPTMVSGRDHE